MLQVINICIFKPPKISGFFTCNMKRSIFIVLLALAYLSVSAKSSKITQYTAINGVTYHLKDTVFLGIGSAANGSFLYLQMGGWGAVVGYDASQGQDQFNIGRDYANTWVVIKSIKNGKVKGVEKYWFIVGGGNITNYTLFIDDGIRACEVVPCVVNNSHARQPVVSDKFDEIKKLKALLDSGAITQAEYDDQKKKLLNQ